MKLLPYALQAVEDTVKYRQNRGFLRSSIYPSCGILESQTFLSIDFLDLHSFPCSISSFIHSLQIFQLFLFLFKDFLPFSFLLLVLNVKNCFNYVQRRMVHLYFIFLCDIYLCNFFDNFDIHATSHFSQLIKHDKLIIFIFLIHRLIF